MPRYVVPCLCVVLALWAFSQARGGETENAASARSAYDAWPAGLVAPAPEASAAELGTEVQGRVVATFRSLDAMWAAAFAKDGKRWTTPKLQFTDNAQRACQGSTPASFAGQYCPMTATIYMNINNLAADILTQDGAPYVLAHEFGHHVQAQRGAFGAVTSPMALELDAQCLAGVWGKATGRPAPTAASYPPDNDGIHGDPGLQRQWLETGYAHARPRDCDPVLR